MSEDSDGPSETASPLTVERLYRDRRESLRLTLLNPGVGLDGEVRDPDISSPGLALAGFTGRFAPGRLQVFGETEITYLGSLPEGQASERVGDVFGFGIPAAFVTKGLAVPDGFLEAATRSGTPLLRSGLATKEFYWRIKPYLDSMLAPRTHVHGSLADVYGVGLLFVGKSGVGKSECVLDLVERGHRFVADDLVVVSRRAPDVLLGEAHHLQDHHMEVRGLGIIDIRALFGIRAIRRQKRIEVMVQLETWGERTSYSRTGLEPEETEILGVPVPKVTVPLNPGKNITVISEVVAMNHLLKYLGVDSAADFDRRLRDGMRGVSEYLEMDHE